MRRFLVLGHHAPVHADFHLNDLPGAAGRIDVLCRAIGASFFLSHGIRRDVETSVLVQDSVRIRIRGDRVKRLNPDERSTAALLRRALSVLGDQEIESTPGIYAGRCTLSGAIAEWLELGVSPIVLHEDGMPFESSAIPENPGFILSDHTDFTEQEERLLDELPRVSLGPSPLHTSQAITIVHYLLDQRSEDLHEDLVLAHKVWGEPKAQMIKGLLEDFGIPVNLMAHAPHRSTRWPSMDSPRLGLWSAHGICRRRDKSSPTTSSRRVRRNAPSCPSARMACDKRSGERTQTG